MISPYEPTPITMTSGDTSVTPNDTSTEQQPAEPNPVPAPPLGEAEHLHAVYSEIGVMPL